ncbi:MAG TPA: hypothetical protein VFF59_02260 [Anaerolineae bacterium]|nr:hypothetical protein [Anaerolineae bacterium]
MKQATLIAMLAMIGFALALVVFIASHLSEEEIALLAGAACGIGLAVPLGVAIGAACSARRRSDRAGGLPPVIYVAQPMRPAVVGALAALPTPQPRLTAPTARPLNIIGQSGFDAEQ